MTLLLPFRRALQAGPWVRNELWRRARAVPSLDLDFAGQKTLTDRISQQQLITFTRASSGTYVGSDGLIKTATTNFLLRSEEFDNASWTKQTSVFVTANQTTSPDGATTADLITWTSATTNTGIYQNVFGLAASVACVRSVWIRADAAGGTVGLADSVFTSLETTVTLTTSWQRVQLVQNASSGGAAGLWVRKKADSPNTIYLWGAQLEQSSTVGEYIPTTSTINSAPRFDHNPTTGESLGLLVEEQRTNLFSGSQDFSNTYWNSSNSTRTNNSGKAPDNTTTACLVTGLGATYGGLVRRYYPSFAASTTYTLSCFAKAGTMDHIGLRIGASCVSGDNYCYFNLSNGTATAITPSAGTVASVSAVAFPNGWYRCVLTYTTSASQGANDFVDIALTTATGSHNYTGTGNALIWGAMFEQASFPTSYIPTTSATVTRSADVASITGANFSSWYRQDEGTVFTSAQGLASTATAGVGHGVFSINQSGSSNNRADTRIPSLGYVSSGGSVVASLNNSLTYTPGTDYRSALTYRVNDFARTTNNSSLSTSSSGAVPASINQIEIGCAESGSSRLNGTIRRLTYWPSRLPNSTLQEITR